MTPNVDADRYTLTVVDAAGRREIRLAELTGEAQTVRAVLDCTSGWYAEQEWTGVPVSSLLTPDPRAGSLFVGSVTGYWVRFPTADIDTLLLATRVGGPAAAHRPWLPRTARGARPARVLVGEVGGPDRAAPHAFVVAAAVPGYLDSAHPIAASSRLCL